MMTPEQKRFKLLMRFMSNVDASGDCWEWQASKRCGYGRIYVDGKVCLAHRASYEIFNAPIAGGLFVLHSCNNRGCVNPEHLRQGTHADNMRDRDDAGRHAPQKGNLNHNATLNEEAAKAIRHLYPEKTQRQLAAAYGVSQALVWKIINRKLWSHV